MNIRIEEVVFIPVEFKMKKLHVLPTLGDAYLSSRFQRYVVFEKIAEESFKTLQELE